MPPSSQDILMSGIGDCRFSVLRCRNNNYYVGVELNRDTLRLALGLLLQVGMNNQ